MPPSAHTHIVAVINRRPAHTATTRKSSVIINWQYMSWSKQHTYAITFTELLLSAFTTARVLSAMRIATMSSAYPLFIALLLLLAKGGHAGPVTYTGYLIDLFCWDLPNHLAIDQAQLDTHPEDHTVICCGSYPYIKNGKRPVASSWRWCYLAGEN